MIPVDWRARLIPVLLVVGLHLLGWPTVGAEDNGSLQRKLDEKADFDIQGKKTTLKKFVDSFAKHCELAIDIDGEAFKKDGVADIESHPITPKGKVDDVTTGAALQLHLDQAHATYRIEKNRILVIPKGVQIEVQQPALIQFATGQVVKAVLVSLNSRQVRIRGVGTRPAEPLAYSAKQVRAVQTSDATYIYNLELGYFERANPQGTEKERERKTAAQLPGAESPSRKRDWLAPILCTRRCESRINRYRRVLGTT